MFWQSDKPLKKGLWLLFVILIIIHLYSQNSQFSDGWDPTLLDAVQSDKGWNLIYSGPAALWSCPFQGAEQRLEGKLHLSMAENPCRRHQGSFSLQPAWNVLWSWRWTMTFLSICWLTQGLEWELWSQSSGGKGRQGQISIGLTQNKNPGIRVRPGHDG